MPKRYVKDHEKRHIAELYRKGKTVKEISEITGWTTETVYQYTQMSSQKGQCLDKYALMDYLNQKSLQAKYFRDMNRLYKIGDKITASTISSIKRSDKIIMRDGVIVGKTRHFITVDFGTYRESISFAEMLSDKLHGKVVVKVCS